MKRKLIILIISILFPVSTFSIFNISCDYNEPPEKAKNDTEQKQEDSGDNEVNEDEVNKVVEYKIGGIIKGLKGTLVLHNLDGQELTIESDGPFTLPAPVPQGAPYTVTVKEQTDSPRCIVEKPGGIVTEEVKDISVICAEYTISGTVKQENPDKVIQMTLQNNKKDDLVISLKERSSFTFRTKIAHGEEYNVTVLEQPELSTCSVMDGTGSALADVSNITVICYDEKLPINIKINGLAGQLKLFVKNYPSEPQKWYYDQINSYSDPESMKKYLKSIFVETIEESGTFTINRPLKDGNVYEVFIWDNPDGQFCSVNNGRGVVTENTVVSVECEDIIMMYRSHGGYLGNLGSSGEYYEARWKADQICSMSQYKPDGFANYTAFISIDWNDEIRDMNNNYCKHYPDGSNIYATVPSNLKIVGPGGIKIADNWADLLDGEIDVSLSDAGVLPQDRDWWSGSLPDGSLAVMDLELCLNLIKPLCITKKQYTFTCRSWTSKKTTNWKKFDITRPGTWLYDGGVYGVTNMTNSRWISSASTDKNPRAVYYPFKNIGNSQGCTACSDFAYLLCIGYGRPGESSSIGAYIFETIRNRKVLFFIILGAITLSLGVLIGIKVYRKRE